MLTPSPDRAGVAATQSGSDAARLAAGDVQGTLRHHKGILAICALVLVSVVLTLSAMIVPRVPSEADHDTRADESWSAVLGFAHQHRLQFGTDLVFTYGPLGFLATPLVADDQIGLRLVSDLLLSLATSIAIVLAARRLGLVWGCLLVVSAFFLFANIYPRSDLLIEAGLVCWGLLGLVESGSPAKLAVAMCVAMAAFGALVKVNLLVLAMLSTGWIGLDFMLRRRPNWAIAVVGGFGAAFMLGWIGLGQNLFHLGAFLSGALTTAQGYNQAMGYEGALELRWRGVFSAAAVVAVLLIRSANAFEDGAKSIRLRRALLGAWSVTLVFLVWKHGFVRTDRYHAGFYFGLIPILLLAAGLLPTTRPAPRFWSQVIALLCWFVCLVTAQSMVLPRDLRFSLLEPFRSLNLNAARVLRPARYVQAANVELSARRERHQLPDVRRILGQSSVDLFGCDQISILCNGLNYRPRPVFQSYAAYNAPLMLLNEAFYLSPAAPQYVLVCLDAQDRKFPPLEDARALRNLLINYEPAGAEGSFLVLKGKKTSGAKLSLQAEGSARPGEKLSLQKYGDSDLWMELHVKPSLLGRAREFLYQPSTIRLVIWYIASGQVRMRRFRAPSPMLAAGFILSPLVVNNDDILHVYAGAGLTRPIACAIEFDPGTDGLWKDQVDYRLFRIQERLGRASTAPLPHGGPP